MRRRNYTEIIDHDFGLGSQLKSRDVKAVRKTVAGLMKLIHPHGEVAKEELRELLELAHGRSAAGEGAAEENGVVRVLPDFVLATSKGRRARSATSAFRKRAGGM